MKHDKLLEQFKKDRESKFGRLVSKNLMTADKEPVEMTEGVDKFVEEVAIQAIENYKSELRVEIGGLGKDPYEEGDIDDVIEIANENGRDEALQEVEERDKKYFGK